MIRTFLNFIGNDSDILEFLGQRFGHFLILKDNDSDILWIFSTIIWNFFCHIPEILLNETTDYTIIDACL